MAEDQPSLMVREGLGNVVAASAEGMPIKLNTKVTHIDWSGQGVRVEMSAGTLRAKACILTVSTGVLRAGEHVVLTLGAPADDELARRP